MKNNHKNKKEQKENYCEYQHPGTASSYASATNVLKSYHRIRIVYPGTQHIFSNVTQNIQIYSYNIYMTNK